jgi:hypothetical protein
MNSNEYDNELKSAEKLSVEEKNPEEKHPEEKPPEEKPSEEKHPEEKKPEEKPSEEKKPEEKKPEEKKPKKKNRCGHCRVKLGLFAFSCKCGMNLCQKHLCPHNHACTFDYMKEKKEIIERNNPKLGENFIKI